MQRNFCFSVPSYCLRDTRRRSGGRPGCSSRAGRSSPRCPWCSRKTEDKPTPLGWQRDRQRLACSDHARHGHIQCDESPLTRLCPARPDSRVGTPLAPLHSRSRLDGVLPGQMWAKGLPSPTSWAVIPRDRYLVNEMVFTTRSTLGVPVAISAAVKLMSPALTSPVR